MYIIVYYIKSFSIGLKIHFVILPGHYTYTFTRPGDYFYSGGNVLGDDQFRMLGSVRVHQQEGTMTPVRVSVNGFEAAYSVPAG